MRGGERVIGQDGKTCSRMYDGIRCGNGPGTRRLQTDMRTTFTDAVVAAVIGTRHRIVADGTASSRENAMLNGRS